MNDEFTDEDLDDEKTLQYIKNRLPQDLKEAWDDDTLTYFLDALDDYYSQSDCLDEKPDEEGYVDLDLDKIAAYLADEAKKDGIGDFTADDLYFVVEAELEASGVLDAPEEEEEK